RAVSALNHPNICTLHDIGRQDSLDYLVMEYLEGETLAERLKKGALPLDQTLRIAIQVAGALDRAHRSGITHRDLKPGNIMLTKSGAKLMDFGLARAAGPASGPAGTALSQTPTMTHPLTAQGTIVGTFQYMAPEQLEGKGARGGRGGARGPRAPGMDHGAGGGGARGLGAGAGAPAHDACAGGEAGALHHPAAGGLRPHQRGIRLTRRVGDLAGRADAGVRGQRYDRHRPPVAAAAGVARGARAARDRGGLVSVLVARQPLHRLLRGRQAQAHRRRRWAPAGAVRRLGRARRGLEPRWDHPVRAVRAGRALPRAG